MSEWTHIKGTQSARPKEVEYASNQVYLRKNIVAVEDTDSDNAEKDGDSHTKIPGWEYDETKLPISEYEESLKVVSNPIYVANQAAMDQRVADLEALVTTLME